MKRLSILDLQRKKQEKEKIVALTAYDATFAALVDEASDIVLVGDSLGMVIQGKENTLSVSLEDMMYHTRAVDQKLKKAHLVTDMPFLSYQVSMEKAIESAGRLLQAGAQSVKLEGGEEVCDLVHRLTRLGMPVMGHLGLTPQSIHQLGGYRVQGKEERKKDELLKDAKRLEEAGAYAVVLESIPEDLANDITKNLRIPTIGIGAGRDCDGQILVIYDLLGMDVSFHPKFVKRYAHLSQTIEEALKNYAQEVKSGLFPDDSHVFH